MSSLLLNPPAAEHEYSRPWMGLVCMELLAKRRRRSAARHAERVHWSIGTLLWKRFIKPDEAIINLENRCPAGVSKVKGRPLLRGPHGPRSERETLQVSVLKQKESKGIKMEGRP